MRVRIVCYENINQWILGKFARRLNEELIKLSIQSDISNVPDPTADINHHIIYLNYDGKKNNVDTVMITHVDNVVKLSQIKKQLKNAAMGICMSEQTRDMLVNSGIPASKVCFVNPAHDGVIKPRPIVIGITSKVHDDGRKKEDALLRICDHIRPEDFMFKIMGYGWEKIVSQMQSKGFTVEYYSKFDYDKYIGLVPTFDYYLYMSNDEGSMGFVDALAAGVKTIVTPQGYHLDAIGGITHPVKNTKSIISLLNKIAARRRKLVDSVSEWTWTNYARQHVEVWESILGKKSSSFEKKEEKTDFNTKINKASAYIQVSKASLHYFTSLRSFGIFIKSSGAKILRHFI